MCVKPRNDVLGHHRPVFFILKDHVAGIVVLNKVFVGDFRRLKEVFSSFVAHLRFLATQMQEEGRLHFVQDFFV